MLESVRFEAIDTLLDAALDMPREARRSFIESNATTAEARAEALSLLEAIEGSDGFLDAREDAAVSHAGRRIGPWRLQHRLGRGGSGEVWQAERADGRFEQAAAIKLLHPGAADDATFAHEQRLLARLQHPHIARLIDAGNLDDGRPYIVMEYVEGMPLTAWCREHAPDLRARLQRFLEVCDAVAFAHRHLIVHRDLKPDHVLVRDDGRVALLDFGIARRIGRDGLVRDGAHSPLTPQYCAPEQFAGEDATTQTDVYALGVLLHEVLTGTSPWGMLPAHGALAAMRRMQADAPVPPSRQAAPAALARRLRGDIDAIVGKALAADPSDRYASVDAFAGDLRRHLAHAPVRARGRAPMYRIGRFLRRHWLAAGTALVVFAGMAAALAAIAIARREAVRERDSAQVEAARSKAVRDYLAHMFRDAGQHANAGDPLTAKQILDRAAARVDAVFSDAPAENAEVLKALGELHFYLNDYTAAEPLLRRWLAHETQIGDPVAAADVRFTLAEALHRIGQRAEARELLAAAQAVWQRDPARHADVLLTSRTLQARLMREDGDADGALSMLEAALAARLARSGRDHFETAALYTNLGAAYSQTGRLDQGIAASREAMTIWKALGLDTGSDALNTLNNLAATEYRKGDLAAAERSFAEALELRRAAYGPSAATAALIGNYARVLHDLGRDGDALEFIGEAEAMALQHAGAGSLLAQSTRVTRAEVALGLRRLDEADDALAAFKEQVANTLPDALRLRAALAAADLYHLRNDTAGMRTAVAGAEALAASMGTGAEPWRARLDTLRSIAGRAASGTESQAAAH